MKADCYPITSLPHVSPLFRDYICGAGAARQFYAGSCFDRTWMQHTPTMPDATRQTVVSLLREQNRNFGAGPATEANLDRLAAGASAVVTGQQVGLFGGPLLTLLKAATAIRLAADATRAGHPHVPVFWLATEDHDFAEINQITLPSPHRHPESLQKLQLPRHPGPGRPVGNLLLGDDIVPLVQELRRCLGDNSISDLIERLYIPTASFGSAFGALIARLFSDHGLLAIDASTPAFHAEASSTLRAALERADDLHAALLQRAQALQEAGYQAQVLVAESSSLLFLLDEQTGARTPLKKSRDGGWSAGARRYETPELLSILESAPERISPNVLLRPVMQDTLLPTSVYVGGPAEVAYYAQCQIVYQHILGSTTAVVPRFSATVVDPRLARILHHHRLGLPDVFTTGNALAQSLGARAMPVEGKRKLSAAGNALDRELQAVTEWMHTQNAGLGHAADVAASKMLYQMNRLRRLSAAFALEQDRRLRSNAEEMCQRLFPDNNLQERVLAGVALLANSPPSLLDTIVEQAQTGFGGHCALSL
ncbi:MAG: bacillithiol biosynthesis cysteine-adding enzyme BshC [Acidobacteriaceae bacterium]